MRRLSLKRLDQEALNQGYVLLPVDEYAQMLMERADLLNEIDFHKQTPIGQQMHDHYSTRRLKLA